MRIAKDSNANPIECDGNTDPHAQYYCCICGESVYPRNDFKKEHGRKREYYFAHYADTCGGNLESYFHWIAKWIIANAREINLPDGLYTYEAVVLECISLHASIRPDALLNQEIIIEICYKNPKAEHEISVFRTLNLTTVEIDISALDFNSSLSQIESLILHETRNKKYLHKRKVPSPVSDRPEPVHPFIVLIGILLAFFGIKKLRQYISAGRSSTVLYRNRRKNK